jgi:hypothetical protein
MALFLWFNLLPIIVLSSRDGSNSKFKVYPSAIGIKERRCVIGGAENAPVQEGAIAHPCRGR